MALLLTFAVVLALPVVYGQYSQGSLFPSPGCSGSAAAVFNEPGLETNSSCGSDAQILAAFNENLISSVASMGLVPAVTIQSYAMKPVTNINDVSGVASPYFLITYYTDSNCKTPNQVIALSKSLMGNPSLSISTGCTAQTSSSGTEYMTLTLVNSAPAASALMIPLTVAAVVVASLLLLSA